MKTIISTLAAIAVSATAAVADMQAQGPGKELALRVFGSMEANQNGMIDMGDFTNFGKAIFVSMDYDDNESITFDEFTSWDFGFNFVAEDAGAESRYRVAQRILFGLWDRDADGEIGKSEYNRSMVDDFRRADLNNDAFLTEEEFTTAYIVGRAYRAAILEN